MNLNPWDVPPFPEVGDSNNSETYAAVGFALSQWEWFEGHLALLYASLVGSGRDEGFAAVRSYGTVVSFNARLKMVREASKIHFFANQNVDLSEKCETLLTHAEKLSARRNEIAHGFVSTIVDDSDERFPRDGGYALIPAYYATSKRLFEPKDLELQITSAKYIYSSKEIRKFAGAFAQLVEPTSHLVSQIIFQKRTE